MGFGGKNAEVNEKWRAFKIARWMSYGLSSRSLCSTDRLTYLQEKEKSALSECITILRTFCSTLAKTPESLP